MPLAVTATLALQLLVLFIVSTTVVLVAEYRPLARAGTGIQFLTRSLAGVSFKLPGASATQA